MARESSALHVPDVAEASRFHAAGLSDVGRQRDVNEDRFHVDERRGVFIVVDGVGGQAAGGKAADIAVRMLRERLERQTGPAMNRVREAITIANNEIFHAAARRAEWTGMACVLTLAVVERNRAIVGHVGDTRLYRVTRDGIVKVTPDHSPVGEREDAREISEMEAMRHPRRNEVFRDVGSTIRAADDPEFIFLQEMECPPDSALLICSDGLTDLVPIEVIRRTIEGLKGRPEAVVTALVRAANDAGGKDNITAVYVEGETFARRARSTEPPQAPPAPRRWPLILLAVLSALALAGWSAMRAGWIPPTDFSGALTTSAAPTIVVAPGESISVALARATAGTTVVVEPGDYRERLTLKDHVRVISRIPRGAVLRLPGTATERDAAVVAAGVTGAELSGFRIIGDAGSPLGTGVLTREASARLVDLEISGATVAAVDLGEGKDVELIGSDIRDNVGTGLLVRAGSTARISHNTFSGNAASDATDSAIVIEAGAAPVLVQNVFRAADAQAIASSDTAMRETIVRDNWFVGAAIPLPRRSDNASPRGR